MDKRKLTFTLVAAQAALVAGFAQAQGRIIYEETPVYRPPVREYVVPATCVDREEALRERRWRLDDSMGRIERERADIDRVARDLADELRRLDPRDRTGVDVYNARQHEHNRRVAAHNADVAAINRNASLLNDEAAVLSADCSYYRSYRWRDVEMLPAYRLR
jgi:hypothetical protein